MERFGAWQHRCHAPFLQEDDFMKAFYVLCAIVAIALIIFGIAYPPAREMRQCQRKIYSA
jgi:hypothetical protein